MSILQGILLCNHDFLFGKYLEFRSSFVCSDEIARTRKARYAVYRYDITICKRFVQYKFNIDPESRANMYCFHSQNQRRVVEDFLFAECLLFIRIKYKQ